MKRVLSLFLVTILLLAALPTAFISAEPAAVTTGTLLYGDINNDGKVNNKDLGLLQQHLNEWDVEVNTTAADVNDDSKINNKDLGLLQQYLNEWNVTLGPRVIKLLSVGNSFSVDAMRNHLYPMLKAAGYTDIRLGILYIGGASIDTHYDNVRLDRAKYDYYENVDGEWVITPSYKASTAFALTDWDIVTLQQVSGHSGRGISYNNLDALVDLIRPQIGDAQMYWHMTWAYQQDSNHSDFANYNNDQMRMYKGILRATTDKIVNNPDFVAILPSGTAIQNLRTSSLGDTLTADGYHLKDSYGDYTAALTWWCLLTGESATSMTYCPAEIYLHFDEIAEAVDNAIAHPFEITPCT